MIYKDEAIRTRKCKKCETKIAPKTVCYITTSSGHYPHTMCERCVLEVVNSNTNSEIRDHIGTVTKGDFENDFRKDFINKKFEELAHTWFKGMEAQIDFSIILEGVKNNYPEGLKGRLKCLNTFV